MLIQTYFRFMTFPTPCLPFTFNHSTFKVQRPPSQGSSQAPRSHRCTLNVGLEAFLLASILLAIPSGGTLPAVPTQRHTVTNPYPGASVSPHSQWPANP